MVYRYLINGIILPTHMALNLKNEETYRLANELSRLTGESMAAAIHVALVERMDRVRQARGTGRAARILAIGRDCAARLKEPYRTVDHGELLYGEDGLPR